MKKAINAWSVPDDVPFELMFKKLSSVGFDGVEINLDPKGRSEHSLTMDSSKSQLKQIKELVLRYQLNICSISTSLYSNMFGSNDSGERALCKDILNKQLEFANELDVDNILVVPGGIGEKTSIKQAFENTREIFLELLPIIEQMNIKIGLENVWNSFFTSPFDMVDFVDSLNCPNIGIYFDIGNVVIFSQPEYWIDILGHRILCIHVKDFVQSGIYRGYFVNLLEGSVRWSFVINALKASGFDGYITAELAPIPQTPDYLYNITSKALDIICR